MANKKIMLKETLLEFVGLVEESILKKLSKSPLINLNTPQTIIAIDISRITFWVLRSFISILSEPVSSMLICTSAHLESAH